MRTTAPKTARVVGSGVRDIRGRCAWRFQQWASWSPFWRGPEIHDRIADGHRAAHEDVGAQAGAVTQWLAERCPGDGLEVRARLAQPHALALHLPDAEAVSDEVVEAHAARRHIAAGLARREPRAAVLGK